MSHHPRAEHSIPRRVAVCLLLAIALAACGTGDGADSGETSETVIVETTEGSGDTSTTDGTDDETATTVDPDGEGDGSSSVTTAGQDDAPATDTTQEEGDDVIDPDDIELNPSVVNPPNKTTPTMLPPADENYDPALEPLVSQATSDLAARLGVDASAIAVRSADLVTWPDAAAGCPQPGMVYTQVVTDGSEIVLTANGSHYRYTTGGSLTTPTLCEN